MLSSDHNDVLPSDLLSAIAAEPKKDSPPWFVYMALKKRKEKKESSQETGSSKKKCSNAGNRVVLRVSEWPFDDIERLNQSGASRGLHHLNECGIDEHTISGGSGMDLEFASACITPKNMVYTGARGKSRSHKSFLRSKTSSTRKGRVGKEKKSCEYKPAMIVGGFKNKEDASLFCTLWNHKSRGLIPRTAWGEVIAEHFKKKVYADPDIIFNDKREHWKLVKIEGKWTVVSRGAQTKEDQLAFSDKECCGNADQNNTTSEVSELEHDHAAQRECEKVVQSDKVVEEGCIVRESEVYV